MTFPARAVVDLGAIRSNVAALREHAGPAAVLAIAGMAIGSAAYSNAYAAPAPVYSGPVYAPPAAVYSAPPARSAFWYFCGSSGQYYPYTNACPEGWQAVPAR